MGGLKSVYLCHYHGLLGVNFACLMYAGGGVLAWKNGTFGL